MTPEPGHRTRRKRYNESRPLTIRVGAIRDELDARSDGSEAGYRAAIMRDLKRYYGMVDINVSLLPVECAHELYQWVISQPSGVTSDDFATFWEKDSHHYQAGYLSALEAVSFLDALERAHILVTHAGLTADAALVAVGLVKEEG